MMTLDLNTLFNNATGKLQEIIETNMPESNSDYLPITNRLARHFIFAASESNEVALYGGHPTLDEEGDDSPIAIAQEVLLRVCKILRRASDEVVLWDDHEASISRDYLTVLEYMMFDAYMDSILDEPTAPAAPATTWDDFFAEGTAVTAEERLMRSEIRTDAQMEKMNIRLDKIEAELQEIKAMHQAILNQTAAEEITIDFTSQFPIMADDLFVDADEYMPITNQLARFFLFAVEANDEERVFGGHPEFPSSLSDAPITLSRSAFEFVAAELNDICCEGRGRSSADADISRDYLSALLEMIRFTTIG
jgi:hypothetical protein